MALTDTAIRTAKPRSKQYKLYDEKGLYAVVNPDGSKWWRFKYRRFNGKENSLSLGVYPNVGVKVAHALRDELRQRRAQGIDPGEHRKAQKRVKVERAANSFEVVAREWHLKHSPGWSESHASYLIELLERDVFPWIGGRPIAEIDAPELLQIVRRIEGRGALETAHRARGMCGQIFRYGISTGRCPRDVAADLRGALPPSKGRNFPALTDPQAVGALLRAINSFRGTLVVQCALRLAPLVFARPGELRQAEWADIDLEAAEWSYIVSKTGAAHIVPLSSQAVAILRELQPLTGTGRYVFPGRDPKRPMSDAAMNAALERMGYDTRTEVTMHGFRATARTLLHEQLHFEPHLIEHQLAHRVPDALGTAYNRTKFLKERRLMMQAWGNYLDDLTRGGKIIPGGFGKAA
jgi:integrase